ncbi:MAG: shikimate kinase [Acidimicrobiia bacterium]
MTRHLVLIGLMGAGKSTVGARCATALDRPFVDTDRLIETNAGLTVAEIFETQGEPAFRTIERTVVADVSASPEPLVVACGGGVALDPDNRRVLRDRGVVVWLRADAQELGKRVGSGEGRPLLQSGEPGGPVGTLERLAVLRAPAYEAAAHVIVDTDGLGVGTVAERVLEEYRTWNA